MILWRVRSLLQLEMKKTVATISARSPLRIRPERSWPADGRELRRASSKLRCGWPVRRVASWPKWIWWAVWIHRAWSSPKLQKWNKNVSQLFRLFKFEKCQLTDNLGLALVRIHDVERVFIFTDQIGHSVECQHFLAICWNTKRTKRWKHWLFFWLINSYERNTRKRHWYRSVFSLAYDLHSITGQYHKRRNVLAAATKNSGDNSCQRACRVLKIPKHGASQQQPEKLGKPMTSMGRWPGNKSHPGEDFVASGSALLFCIRIFFFFFFRVCLVAACRWPLHTTLPLDMNVSQRPLDSSCVPIRNGLSLVRNFTIFRSIFQFFKTRKSNRLKRWKRPWRHLGKYWQLWQRCNPALIRLPTKI